MLSLFLRENKIETRERGRRQGSDKALAGKMGCNIRHVYTYLFTGITNSLEDLNRIKRIMLHTPACLLYLSL